MTDEDRDAQRKESDPPPIADDDNEHGLPDMAPPGGEVPA